MTKIATDETFATPSKLGARPVWIYRTGGANWVLTSSWESVVSAGRSLRVHSDISSGQPLDVLGTLLLNSPLDFGGSNRTSGEGADESETSSASEASVYVAREATSLWVSNSDSTETPEAPEMRTHLDAALRRLEEAAEAYANDPWQVGAFEDDARSFARTYGDAGLVALQVEIAHGRLRAAPLRALLTAISTEDSLQGGEVTFWFVEKCLQNPEASVRDGAVVALLNYDDPRGASLLHVAAAQENISELRREMEEGAEYLTSA